MTSRLKQLLLLGTASLGLAVLIGLLHSSPAAAAGEIFTWKDNRTITVSGGDVKTPSDILLTNAAVSGDQSAIFAGNILYNKGRSDRGCTVSIQIYLFKASGNGAGRTWNPPPYDGPVAGDPNAPPRCSTSGAPEMDAPMHDKWISITGTRPGDPNAPEREEEKRFDVYVFAPDPLSRVPASDTVFIYTSAGQLVGQQSSPFKDDSGAADWPPDQTPAAMRVTFALEPGDYVVCDTYVAKECNYTKATQAQKFKKEKYKASSINLGTPFQTPDKKRVIGNIEYHVKRPCGSALDISAVGVALSGPDGLKQTKQTPPKHIEPLPNEEGAICTVDVVAGSQVIFENMPAGGYKACATGAECVTFTKKDGEAATFTLIIKTEQTAPPNQKVCTSGEGVAGALAWIICPATELIAKATTFFEQNIIVPFMTVSPLTTNEKNPIYILWQAFRDIANVGFVVLLFIAIFSIALSKYGMKRLLPRLLIVAIGINLSYFVVAFLIDAFNLLGSGVSQFVMSALQQAGTTQLNSGTESSTVRDIFTLGGAALVTILVTGGSAIGWLFSFLGIAALIVVAVVVLLIIRQLAIIVLVILSPVAILLYLLPNTENWFTKWRETLLQLLIMYPLMVLLFASGKVFGLVLQQPDFQIAGDGVSDDVAQAVRVILQFVVYVLPLAFLPATFAASGTLMAKGYALLANNRVLRQGVQKPGQAFGERVIKPKRQELITQAMRRGGVIGKVAGFNERRRFKQAQQERETERAREHYLTNLAANNPNFARRAAGVGGDAGITRVQGTAMAGEEAARKADIQNEKAIFEHQLREVGLNTKSFNDAFSKYLEDPTTNNIVTGTVRNTDGTLRTIDLNKRQDLTRSALNSAAQMGEITTLEKARLSSGISQPLMDEVLRTNDSAVKSKGGYHLVTDSNLAHGRSGGTQRDVNIARLRKSFAASGEDIAGMKASFVNATLRTLQNPTTRAQIMTGAGALTTTERDAIRKNIDTILASPNVAAGAKNIDGLKKIRNSI